MKINKLLPKLLAGIILFTCFSSCSTKRAGTPNIIYILADDLGYGDLSCYGQERFSTPNLDSLAAGGIRFLQHYSGSTVCAPSRSSLMTGQHTGHTPIRGNKEVRPEGQVPLPDQAYTLAELLKEKGYVTGAFGKWGLGYPGSEGDPNNQGFDVFFGYNCQRLAHHYYPWDLRENQEKVILGENEGHKTGIYGPDLIHHKAIEFIEKNKDKPFFLYYPSIIPHAELFAPERYMARFRGKFLPEKEYRGTDEGEGFRQGAYGSQPEAHAAFAAMITLLDEQVGEIVATVKALGLDENTLIIFSSDNGPHLEGGADPDYFDSNGKYRGYKRDLYEGGIRVPMIARWPGKINPGSTTDHLSAFWDLLPTVAEILALEKPPGMDGISFLPTLLGEPGQKKHDYLYWEFHERNGRQAIRQGDWKLVRYNVLQHENETLELYHIPSDPGEENNLAAENMDIVEELLLMMNKARTESEVFGFGESKVLEKVTSYGIRGCNQYAVCNR